MIIRLRQAGSPPKAICFLKVFAKSGWMFTRRTSTRHRKKHGITGGSSPMWLLESDYWGHTPDLILHPLRCGARPVPWLVADGYIANYADVLNSLQLILVTSNWVRETYIRHGIDPKIIEVLPVGCDTDSFIQRPRRKTPISAAAFNSASNFSFSACRCSTS